MFLPASRTVIGMKIKTMTLLFCPHMCTWSERLTPKKVSVINANMSKSYEGSRHQKVLGMEELSSLKINKNWLTLPLSPLKLSLKWISVRVDTLPINFLYIFRFCGLSKNIFYNRCKHCFHYGYKHTHFIWFFNSMVFRRRKNLHN